MVEGRSGGKVTHPQLMQMIFVCNVMDELLDE